jgi:uncharacterized protein YkwD
MRARYTFAFALAMLSLCALMAVGAPAQHSYAITNCDTPAAGYDSEEQAFLQLINNYRKQNGLAALSPSPSLDRSAAWKSQDMGANSYFAHDDTPIGRTWDQRIRDCGYTYNAWIGENIAAGMSTAAAAFQAWRDSPDHNANMLSANYNAIGIGRAYVSGSPYGWYWSTDFGGVTESPPTPTPPPPTATPPGPPSSYPCADFTHDGIVNVQDIIYAVSQFGKTGSPADMDRNGTVSVIDILIVVHQFGTSC